MTLFKMSAISWLRAGAGVEADGRAHGAGDADEKFEAGPPPAGQGGGKMGQIDPGPGFDDVIGKGYLSQGFGKMQGNAGQTLVGDEQVGAPAQVKNRPAFSLGSPRLWPQPHQERRGPAATGPGRRCARWCEGPEGAGGRLWLGV